MTDTQNSIETTADQDLALNIVGTHTEEQKEVLEHAAQHFAQYTDPEAAIDSFLEQHFDQVTGKWKSESSPGISDRPEVNIPSEQHLQRPQENSPSPTMASDRSETIRAQSSSSDDATELGDDDEEESLYGRRYYCQESGCPVYRKANRNGKYSMRAHYQKAHPKVKFDTTKLVKVKPEQEVKNENLVDDLMDWDWPLGGLQP